MKSMKTYALVALLAGLFYTHDLVAQISGQVVNFHLNRYNSASNGDKLPVKNGENLATMQFKGWTPGNEYQAGAGFSFDVTGDPAPGFLPARMSFWTGGAGLLERMTILENGNVGIGLSNPVELVDINGNMRIRGMRVYLGLPGNAAAAGGEALTQSDRDCAGNPAVDALTLNYNGDFTGGVYVEGPGLKVCGELEAECLKAHQHVIAEEGNIFALGGSGVVVQCTDPGEGDFIAEGANGDFIARHGNFIAEEGSVTARQDITSTQGSVVANQHVTAQNGNVSAGQDVSAGNNVFATNSVSAGTTVTAGTSISAGTDLSAGGNLSVTGNGTIGGNARIGTITGNPGSHVLAVGGSMIAEEVNVKLQADWPDYVFSNDHQRPTLQEVENFIQENNHLPGVPSAAQVAQDGLPLGKMQVAMMEKLEELYLHVIELNRKVEQLEKENKQLKAERK